MNLRTKGFLIVGIPLVCQLIFVFVLFNLLNNINSEMARESFDRDIVSAVNSLTRDSAELVYKTYFAVEVSGDAVIPEDIGEGEAKKVVNGFTKIYEATANDPVLHEQLHRLYDIQRRAYAGVSVWRQEASKTDPDRPRVKRLERELIELTSQTPREIAKFEELRTIRSRENPLKSNELRMRIRISIAAFFFLSISGTIIIGMLFSKSIRNPLQHILTNARLLSKREPLLKPLEGGGELNELDKLVVRVSQAVYSALDREKELLENAAELICSLDEQGIFRAASSYTRTMLRNEPEDLIGKTMIEFVYGDDCVTADEELKAARSSDKPFEFELRLLRSDGMIVDTRWFTFWSEAQNLLFCVVHDLTEEKNLDRLKQDFVNMVSHDLRSPLMSMHGSMTMLASGVKGPVSDMVRTDAEKAARSIERLTGMINDLLDFQKLQAGKMQIELTTFSLQELVVEAVEMVRSSARKKQVQITLPDNDITVTADQSKLRQVLVNFLSNAVKFSPEDQNIGIELESSNGFVEVRISDSGPGIAEEYQEKVFEAFEQVPGSEKASEGSGLGLAICKMIATAHGGMVGVTSQPAEKPGSIFWIKLPVNVDKSKV